MAANFVNIDRDTPFLMPPSPRDWVAEDDLVHFILEAVLSVNVSSFKVNQRGSGSPQYPPRAMLALLIYCYSRGTFSGRKIEQATYRDVAVRYLMGGHHPDFHTICTFRKTNKQAIEDVFLEVLLLANKLELLKVGTVSVDGTRIKADASKHRNVRYDRAEALIEKLKADIADLMAQAEAADSTPPDDDDRLPAKIARREVLKAKLEAARKLMEDEAHERSAAKHREYEQKKAARDERLKHDPNPGPPCKAPPPTEQAVPEAKRQANLTDSDSRLMSKRGEITQGYNAQAVVDTDSLLILSAAVFQSTDMGLLKPMVDSIDPRLGRPRAVLADSGYAKIADIDDLRRARMRPHVAVGSENRREYDFRIPNDKPPQRPPSTAPTLVKMKAKLETDRWRRRYRLRQQTVEPVFGVVKEAMGFRQFSLRGLEAVKGEWTLVALAYNLKRLAVLKSEKIAA